MTIDAADSRIQYTAAAGRQVFNVIFEFEQDSDLKVYQTLSGATPDPATDILVLNTNYTVIGAGWSNPGVGARTITLTVGAAAGDIITIIRDMPLARSTDFTVSGEFSAADLNDQFDDLVGMIQQVNTQITNLGLLYVNNQIVDQSSLKLQNTLPLLADATSDTIPIWTTNTSGTLVASSLVSTASQSTLRTDLANETNGGDGAKLVGYYNATLSPVNTTVDVALNTVIATGPSIFGFVGQVLFGYLAANPAGWLLMDDGTVGSLASAADHNLDAYEDLFTALWTACADAECPVSSGRGASAAADWAANKTIRLPQVVGRAVAVDGQPALTSTFTHAAGASDDMILADTSLFTSGMKVRLTTTGTLPVGWATATDYYIEVSSGTVLNIAANVLDYTNSSPVYVSGTGAGAGVHTVEVQFDASKAAGEYEGYPDHIMTLSELVAHTHTISTLKGHTGSGSIGEATGTPGTLPTNSTGTSVASRIVQPTTHVPAYIKFS